MSQITKVSGGTVYSTLLKAAQNADQPPEVPAPPAEEKPKEPEIFTIPESNMGFLYAQIEKLNKVAAKLNVEPIKIEILKKEIHKRTVPGSIEPIQIPVNVLRIIGHAPKLNGWILAARILHTEEGNIIKATPAAGNLPEAYRKTAPICEYCKTARDRRDTFLVKNEATGDIKQIGRNCLKDFLGHPNPEMYAKYAEMLADMFSNAGALEDEDGGEGGRGGRGTPTFTIEGFLKVVAAIRRSFGWVSRTLAKQRQEQGKGGGATADDALSYLSNARAADEITKAASKMGKPLQFLPEDEELINKALEWIKGIKEGKDANQNLSDYLWNLSVASSTVVTHKTAGIVASLLSAYERANSALPANTTPGEASKGYVGTPNKPITIKGKLMGAKPISSYSGRSILYSVQDESGNLITWFDNTGAAPTHQLGAEVMVTGIVKSHKEFRGQPQTELAGARFIDETEFNKIRAEEAVAADAAKAGQAPVGPAAPQIQYNPGDKIPSINLTLLDKKFIDGEWGASTVHTFVDDTGRQFKWFASKAELEIGKKYTVKATVKKEEEYKGVKSVVLTRLDVISVGGQKAVTTKDINAKRKEVGIIQDQMTKLTEEINAQHNQIREISNQMEKEGKRKTIEDPAQVDESIQYLQTEIQKARALVGQSKEFSVAQFPGNLIGYRAVDYLNQFVRKYTPQEFMDKANPRWTQMQAMNAEMAVENLLQQEKQLSDEYYKARGNWQMREQASKLMVELNAVNAKINEIRKKYPDLQTSGFLENYEKAQKAMEGAQQAQQAGATEWGDVPSQALNYMESDFRRKLTPEEFVQRAEELIRGSLEFKQITAPFAQKLAELEQAQIPVAKEYQLKMEELHQLESMKGKAKQAGADWVLKNCKFANSAYPLASDDEWYGDRDYQAKGGEIQYMPPKQFLSMVRPLQLDETAEDNIQYLMDHINNGGRLDPLIIYPNGKEDGRHRAVAAMRLNIPTVPVIIFKK